jgi:hypothetical protein
VSVERLWVYQGELEEQRPPEDDEGLYVEVVLAADLDALLEARAALADLVRLKDGPRDDAYRVQKDAAWDRGRNALAAQKES